ncbi:protein kinase [Permianibacter sp. IMCC34836]|uniref:serine/threonine-protein kinase n=1 Tax=Permianibacter fluminis TaxID=2738515 RepID=UPI00155424ED|nr:serine/threonine-protein kinase [Permianibacter fluminis]NQD38796.1 protein kinase [Permianibacter fluminis]
MATAKASKEREKEPKQHTLTGTVSPESDPERVAVESNRLIAIPGYRIVRPLGQGGMATVYLAVQESFEREVALKIMAPELLQADPSYAERFLREARIVARLIDPHIVTVHDVGVSNGLHYLAMEYIPGDDLRKHRQHLSLAQALGVLKQIAQALEHAHLQGYVHRDIKPENILIHRQSGRAVLTDFGIARPLGADDDSQQFGGTIGTPAFMSPEQALGQVIDHRSDLYSLGVVCYFLLTGKVPFAGDAPAIVGMKHALDPVPRLPAPLALCQPLIDTALAKHPNQRYQTGAEFAAAIDALLSLLQPEHDQFWRATALTTDTAYERTRLVGAQATQLPVSDSAAASLETSSARAPLSASVTTVTPAASKRSGSVSQNSVATGTSATGRPATHTTTTGNAAHAASIAEKLAPALAALQRVGRVLWRWLGIAAAMLGRVLRRAAVIAVALWRRWFPVVSAALVRLASRGMQQLRRLAQHLWTHRADRRTQLQTGAVVLALLLGFWLLHTPDWSTSSARQAYREGELSKAEYEVILKQLKAEHQARLDALRREFQQQDLTREEYLQKVKEAKQDYTGVEDCGSWLGC